MYPPRKRQRMTESREPEKQLSENEVEEVRKRNEQKLQGRFSAIYAKYERDFGETSDEIDLVSGQVVVDKGHLRHMRHERDIGDQNPRALLKEEQDKEEADDELTSSNGPGQPSIWSEPEVEATAEPWAEVSDRLAAQVVDSAMHSGTGLDMSDPAFINTFSMNIMRQVTQVMQRMQNNRPPQHDLAPPSTNARLQLPSATVNTSIDDEHSRKWRAPSRSLPPRRAFQSKRSESCSVEVPNDRPQRALSRSVPPRRTRQPKRSKSRSVDALNGRPHEQVERRRRKPTFAVLGRRRYTSHENRLVIELMQNGEPDWDEARRKLPDRTEVAIRVQWGRLRRAGKTKLKDVSCENVGATPRKTGPRRRLKEGSREAELEVVNDTMVRATPLFGRPRRQLKEAPTEAAKPDRSTATLQRFKWSRNEDDRLVKLWRVDKLSLRDIAKHFPGRSKGAISNRYRYRLYINNEDDPAKREIDDHEDDVVAGPGGAEVGLAQVDRQVEEPNLGTPAKQETDEREDTVVAGPRLLGQSTFADEQAEAQDMAASDIVVVEGAKRSSQNSIEEPQIDKVEDDDQAQIEVEVQPESNSTRPFALHSMASDGNLHESQEEVPGTQSFVSDSQSPEPMECAEDFDTHELPEDPALINSSSLMDGSPAIEPRNEQVLSSTLGAEDDEDELTQDMALTPPPSTMKALGMNLSPRSRHNLQSTPASRTATSIRHIVSGGPRKASTIDKTLRTRRREPLPTPDPSSPSYGADAGKSTSSLASIGKLRSVRKRAFSTTEDEDSGDELAS